MSNLPKTSLIIPVYCATRELADITTACLESLEYGRPDEVIIVDDGSDLKPQYRRELANKFRYRAANGGYAAAVNDGLEMADGEILIVANNDIQFTPGWLEAIIKPLQNGYDISSIRNTEADGYETEDKITEDDKFGAIWAITRAAYTKLGPLDTRFGKGYFEDLDYRRRALDAGLRIAKNHSSVVEHIGRATFREVDPENRSYHQAREVFRDKWSFVE